MRTNLAKRYARWSAAAAIVVGLAVAGLYLRRAWELRQVRQQIPAEVPSTVQEQSAAFSFSKVEGNRTAFTVRASKATEYASDGRDLLEDVWVTLYGASGQRFDNLHTRSCEYRIATGDIHCAGEAQIDLQSADDARMHPAINGLPSDKAKIIHVKTSAIVFNQKTGNAATDAPVSFQFPRGEGRGVGFRYDSEQGLVRLLRDVNLVFYPEDSSAAAAPSSENAENLVVAGSSLVYFRDQRRMRLLGPVSGHQEARDLSAATAELEFDSELRARQLSAFGSPVLREIVSGESRAISADKMSAEFSTAGWLEKATAEGHVQATAHRPAGEDQLDSDRAEIAFAGANSRPQLLTATGSVRVQTVLAGGGTRSLNTSEIVLEFANMDVPGPAQIRRATTPAATLETHSLSVLTGQSVPEQVHLTSQHLTADFAENSQLRQVLGTGGVEVRRQTGDQPMQVSTSAEMTARFGPAGEWSTVDQSGDVRLSQADRRASAPRAHFDNASDTAALEGGVQLVDSQTRTTAKSALLREAEDRLIANGNVVSSDLSATGSAIGLGPGPARVSGDRMVADTQTGHAVYSGRARLWQGDTLVEADSVELDHESQQVDAVGHVRAVFPKSRLSQAASPSPKPSGAGATEYVHAQGRRMSYYSSAGHGHFEGDARAESDEGNIRSDSMDLFFAPASATAASANSEPESAGPVSPSSAARLLVRAVATGHVIVDQQDREGTADQAEYTAGTHKVVLTGGPPKVRDASGNVTTGRQLTLFLPDDTINIDSAEGTRTLTLHRVEK